ncbi:MAG: hypothetical protein NVSMB9_28910 [Isosphaeraceae bacterium]
MGRRPRNRLELRIEAERAEALGVDTPPLKKKAAPTERRPKPVPQARQRIVWAVCDLGGRTVATYDYADKEEAEARIAQLKSAGKGEHFLRSLKAPMD